MPSNAQQKGFSLLAVIAIILGVFILGTTAVYVYKSNQDDSSANKANNSTPQQSSSEQNMTELNQEAAEPIDSWITFTSASGKFSLKYPTSWKLPRNFELCPEETFLIGPDEDTVGICQSDKPSQIWVHSEAGDTRDLHDLTKYPDEYADITKADISVRGIDGVKFSATYILDESIIPEGTKIVSYIFYTNGRTYRAIYNQLPTFPGNLDVFEAMVAKTLRFSE